MVPEASTWMPISLPSRLNQHAEAWNEAEISRASLGRWIHPFHRADKPVALRLLECMPMHGWARLIQECRLLQQRLFQIDGAGRLKFLIS